MNDTYIKDSCYPNCVVEVSAGLKRIKLSSGKWVEESELLKTCAEWLETPVMNWDLFNLMGIEIEAGLTGILIVVLGLVLGSGWMSAALVGASGVGLVVYFHWILEEQCKVYSFLIQLKMKELDRVWVFGFYQLMQNASEENDFILRKYYKDRLICVYRQAKRYCPEKATVILDALRELA